MSRRTTVLALFVSTIFGSASADEPPDLSREELTRRGMAAAAVVDYTELSNRIGTAFCVHPSGLFVTVAEPFVSSMKPFNVVPILIRPGRPDQVIREAKVVRRWKNPGLTLLQVDGVDGLVALPMGSAASIEELLDVAVFDVPAARSAEQLAKKAYPPIHMAVGSISATQRKEGQVERVQFDAALSPGSVGGPLVDLKGRVLGVILGRARTDFGAGVDLAIPVNRLGTFLDQVEVKLAPLVFNAANLHQPVEFVAALRTVYPSNDPLEVELGLAWAGKGVERRFPMTLAEGSYRARAVPDDAPPAPLMVRVEATFDDRTFDGLVEDRTIRVAGSPEVRLGEVRRLVVRPKAVAWLGNGVTLEGASVAGLGEVSMVVGGQTLPVDLRRARMIVVRPPADDPAIACSVVARRAGREVGRRVTLVYPVDRASPSLDAVRAGRFIRPARSETPVNYLSFEGGPLKPSDPRPSVALRGGDFRVVLADRGNLAEVSLSGRVKEVRRVNRKRGITVESARANQTARWAFQFEAPGVLDFAAGDYPDARGMDINGERPEMKFIPGKPDDYSWYTAQNIGNSGHFVVWEFETKSDEVTRLAIDFEGRCDTASTGYPGIKPFAGMIRYNATFR